MKRTVIFALTAILLLSACAKKDPDFKDTVTVQKTEAVTTEEVEKPAVISLDEIKALIDGVKAEYASADKITLSDGTEISAEVKDPGICAEDIKSGAASSEEISDAATYIARIRQIACDRIGKSFPDKNIIEIKSTESASDKIVFLFLDPASDGFTDAGDAYLKMSDGESGDDVKIVTDCIIVNKSTVMYYEKGNTVPTLLCPTEEENAVLSAIAE